MRAAHVRDLQRVRATSCANPSTAYSSGDPGQRLWRFRDDVRFLVVAFSERSFIDWISSGSRFGSHRGMTFLFFGSAGLPVHAEARGRGVRRGGDVVQRPGGFRVQKFDVIPEGAPAPVRDLQTNRLSVVENSLIARTIWRSRIFAAQIPG